MIIRTFSALSLLILSITASAQTEQLALHPDWIKLNYYSLTRTGWKSSILNDDFFFSPNGKSNPPLELEAFHNAYTSAQKNETLRKRVCLYPARIDFLHRHFKTQPLCKTTDTYKYLSKIQGASLVFANGFFGNPASYYGHVLLKFHEANTASPVLPPSNLGLFDQALNYGAKVPNNEDIITYIFKGIFGLYTATYKKNHYFLNNIQYADQESRDIWVYHLNLPKQQLQFLAKRSLELEQAEFQYYFFNDNCAHRIRDLLNEATGKNLAPDNGVWMFPMQLITAAAQASTDDKPLVHTVEYYPSNRTRFLHNVREIKPNHQSILIDTINGDISPQNIDLPDNERKRILVLADTQLKNQLARLNLEYPDTPEPSLSSPSHPEKDVINTKRQKILLEVASLRDTPYALETPPKPEAPHLNLTNGSSVSLSTITSINTLQRPSFTLTLRPAYTDTLSPDIGKITNSTLHMGLMRFRIDEHSAYLDHLTFFEVQNLHTSGLSYALAKEQVWELSAGLTRYGLTSKSQLAPYLQIGSGKDLSLHTRLSAYAIAGIQLSLPTEQYSIFSPNIKTGLLLRASNSLKFQSQLQFSLDADNALHTQTLLSGQYLLHPTLSLAGRIEKYSNSSLHLQISLSHYF